MRLASRIAYGKVRIMAGSISSAGLGSGLDVAGIIDKLMQVERQPLAKIANRGTQLQTQLSAFGQIQSLVSSFKDSLTPLTTAANYTQMSAASSDRTAVDATASTGSIAGSYAVSVSALASGQTVVSPAGRFANSTDAVGEGRIKIRLGTWTSAPDPGDPDRTLHSFTPKIDSADVVLDIGPPAESLAKIRDKINAANSGVVATIVRDASGTRLSLVSRGTGLDAGFRVTVENLDPGQAPSAQMAALGYDPQNNHGSMELTTAAANTEASINGIAVSSASTTLDNVIEGLTIKATKITTAPVNVTVSRNSNVLKAQVEKFVEAYNGLNSFLGQLTGYDAQRRQGGLLQGDRTAVGLTSGLRATLGSQSSSSNLGGLSALGIQFQRDGSLKLDTAKFDQAMQTPEVVQAAMAPASPSAPPGLFKRISTWADQMVGTEGMLKGRSKSIESQIAAIGREQERAERRISQVEERLRKQYSNLDTTISQANQLQSYVSQQMTALARSLSGS
jgi:flagellar hook-associated protein 2